MRSRVVSAHDPAYDALSLAAPILPLSRWPHFRETRGYCALDPRPRAPFGSRFSRNLRCRASLSPAAAYRLLQLSLPTRGHTYEHPIPTFSSMLPCTHMATSKIAPAFHRLVRDRRPSPLEEGLREPRAATVFPKPLPRRSKHAAGHDSESHLPTETPLAGDAPTRQPLAAVAVGRWR